MFSILRILATAKEVLTDQVEQTPPQKPKRSFLQKTIRALLVIVIVLLILIGFVISFSQTSWFRNIVRSQIENLIEKNTKGTLTLGRIEGDLISGFTIHEAHLKLRGDTTEIISLNELYARYSIWKFITGNDIPVTTLILRSPKIQLVKLSGDSLWNYERLFPSKNSQGPSSPFNLTIDVQHFRIENGKFFVRDYNSPVNDTSVSVVPSFDWGDYSAQNIDLDMRVHIAGEKSQRIQIDNLSLLAQSRNTAPFTLHHLECAAYRNDLHTELTGLHIISSGSDIRLTAEFDPLRVLSGEPLDSLAHSNVQFHLSASSVNERELRMFLPDLSFLEGSPKIELDASGEFGKLKIKKGSLGFRHDGEILFSGEIRNLHDPVHLYLDVLLKAHSLTDRTLRNYVPGLDIEDMQRFGTVNIEKLTFTGYTNNFASNFDISSSAGSAKGKASLDLRSSQLIYAADASTKNINLTTLTGDPNVRSDLNSSFHISGKGTNPKTMLAQFSLDAEGTTEFKHYQLDKFHIGGKIGGAKLELENTDMALHSGATVHSDYASLDLSGKTPSYDFDITTKELPITDFVPMFPPASKVSVEANLNGTGLSANNITGSINAEISGLEMEKKALPNILLQATLERDEAGNRVDVITSSIADLTFKGKYNIETLGSVIADRAGKISDAIKNRGKQNIALAEELKPFSVDSIDLSYAANIKDLRPIAPFIPNTIFLGSGKLTGSIIGSENGPLTVATQGNIHNFFMRARHPLTDSSGIPLIRLRDTKISLMASGIENSERNLLQSFHSEIRLQSDSILKFAGTIVDKPEVFLGLSGGDVSYRVSGNIAGAMGVYAAGIGNISRPDLSFQFDTLSLAFGKSFIWRTERSSHLLLRTDGSIELDTISMIRPVPGYDPENKFAERIRLGFRIRGDSIDYAFVKIPELDLVDLPKFFSNWVSAPEFNFKKGRLTKMEAFLNGSLSHPVISADLALKSLEYQGVSIDSARMNVLYKNLTLSGEALFHVDSAAFSIDNIAMERENFLLSGANSFRLQIDSIPFLFSLKKYPEYAMDSAAVSKREMSIRALGKDYPLDMFSSFVPVIANLHGLADIELSVKGTTENILYKGLVNTQKGSFLLPTTNMRYTFNGKLLLSNDTMKFVGLNLANMSYDDAEGRAVLEGALYFKGFDLQRFELNLTIPNRLSVLCQASEQTLKNIYGPLAIRTDGGPLTFSGDVEEPLLAGNITIVQGFLTLPQSDASSTNLMNDGIIYRLKKDEEISDTLRHASIPDSLKHILKGLASVDTSLHYNDTAFEEATRTATQNAQKPQFTPIQLSFQDKMLYDLQISVPGQLWFVINLTKLYGAVPQTLTAQIKTDGPISFVRKEAGAEPSVNAHIILTDKSTYSFIKEFSPVTGTLTFSNNLDNPSLDITAEYTGVHKLPNSTDETIRIKLIVQGTRNDLQLAMELYRKNIQGEFIKDSRPQDEVKADVITYLTSGTFAGDVQSPNNSSVTNATVAAGSQILNAALNNYLGSISFLKDYVRSVGFEYNGAQSGAKLKLSGQIKDIVLNLGGTVNNSTLLSSDVSVEIPLSQFFNFPAAHNILIQGESHIANSSDPNSQGLTQQPIFLGRFLYRFSP